MTRQRNLTCQSLLLTILLVANAAHATKPANRPQPQNPPVDVVIALDVSGSMSGLIESAKQRLWDIVNEIGQAQPQPDLRLAIITYGNPAYGEQGGYVRIDMPFTRDLDAVNQTLFSFGTDGGDEYVARAVHTAVNELEWSDVPDAMRVLFVAGNERADQDPLVQIRAATAAASRKGIVVNTLYCGRDGDAIVGGWQDVATLTNGLFASIDQDAAAVANVATPMDDELARLNRALNDTYVAYGVEGDRYKQNQLEQDENAADMNMPSVASRAIAKAGALYRNTDWDLVDAAGSGVDIGALDTDELPEPLRDMKPAERKAFVADLAQKRAAVSAEITQLGQQRQDYIDKERARLAASTEGLDTAIIEGIRNLAEEKGFSFEMQH